MNAIPYALLTLAAIFGFVVAWSLNQFWKFTIGFMFDKLAKVGIPTGFFGSVHPLSFLEGINNSVHDFLSGIAAASEHAMVHLFGQLVKMLLELGREIGSLAEAVEQRFLGLVRGTLPKLIRGAVSGLWSQAKRIPALIKRVEGLLSYVERRIKKGIATAIAFAFKQLKHAGKFAAHLASGALKTVGHLVKRIGALERKLVGKRLAHLINQGLLGLGLPWVLAHNVIAIAKAVVAWSSTLARAVIRYISAVNEPISLEDLTRVSGHVVVELEHALSWYLTEYHKDRIAPGSTIRDIEV